MKRIASSLMLFGWWICCGLGCAHMVETETVTAFAESLRKSDIEKLREQSSPTFNSNVLRRDDAIEAMKQLNLPTGEMKVVEVKGDDNAKEVEVEIGERKSKMLFKLVRNPDTKQWLVDDIQVKRKMKGGRVNQTLAEQMDLMLSVRDILDAWQTSKRDSILDSSTKPLAQALGELPPACLTKLAKRVAGTSSGRKDLRPVIEGHGDDAIARVPGAQGDLYITMRKVDDRWKAHDLHVQSRRDGDHVPSVRKLAAITLTSVKFYEAYSSQDRETLSKVCIAPFFDRALKAADLSSAPLPELRLREGDYEIRMQATRALVLVKHPEEMIQFGLVEQPLDELADKGALPVYLVEDVSIFGLDKGEERRLSAMLTSHAVMHVFSEALIARDLKTVQFSSTQDFNKRVWQRLGALTLADLPLEQIEPEVPQVLHTSYKGPITEITVNQGRTPLTYVLREQNGNLLVDDIETPALNRPESLKATLEVMVPIRNFTLGFHVRKTKQVMEVASRDFNRMVFSQLPELPPLEISPVQCLRAPLTKIILHPERAIVTLGDDNRGAKVFLVVEQERYVVDDVVLIAGPAESQRAGLKQVLRAQVMANSSVGSAPAVP